MTVLDNHFQRLQLKFDRNLRRRVFFIRVLRQFFFFFLRLFLFFGKLDVNSNSLSRPFTFFYKNRSNFEMFGYKLVNLLHPTMVLTKREISFETREGKEKRREEGNLRKKSLVKSDLISFSDSFQQPGNFFFFFFPSLSRLSWFRCRYYETKRNETKRRVVDACVSKTR